MPLRILLLADTHLGFDLPLRPRVRRRRRGEDFLENYRKALEPALRGEVDLVVHGGDVFHRPRVPTSLVHQAFQPLREVARGGIPVFVVPGNHERGRIPHPRLAGHPGIHIFHEPGAFDLNLAGLTVRLFGFPYARKVRRRFPELLRELGLGGGDAQGTTPPQISLLCMHQCVEGSRVEGHTFRNAPDVIRARDLPGSVAAVVTGHVHRHQVLQGNTSTAGPPAPVFYPGSVERTSFSERREAKGYLILEVEPGSGERAQAAVPGQGTGGSVAAWTFHPLPARPMIVEELVAEGMGASGLSRAMDEIVQSLPSDAILRLRLRGAVGPEVWEALSAESLRARCPSTMNLNVVFPDQPGFRRERRRGKRLERRRGSTEHGMQLSLLAPDPPPSGSCPR